MKKSKAYVLSGVDRAHQLELLPDPHLTHEPRSLSLDGPQPGTEKRSSHDVAGLGHATADLRPQPSFAAVVRDQGRIIWRCQHVHRSPGGALTCAWQARVIHRSEPTFATAAGAPPDSHGERRVSQRVKTPRPVPPPPRSGLLPRSGVVLAFRGRDRVGSKPHGPGS
jgi:hypothetical protein